jgi:hypothetical protein
MYQYQLPGVIRVNPCRGDDLLRREGMFSEFVSHNVTRKCVLGACASIGIMWSVT